MYFPRLKELRENRRLTQAYIGKILHIRQNVYSRYESGLRTITLECLIVLAVFYDVSVDYILSQTDDPTPYYKRKAKEGRR